MERSTNGLGVGRVKMYACSVCRKYTSDQHVCDDCMEVVAEMIAMEPVTMEPVTMERDAITINMSSTDAREYVTTEPVHTLAVTERVRHETRITSMIGTTHCGATTMYRMNDGAEVWVSHTFSAIVCLDCYRHTGTPCKHARTVAEVTMRNTDSLTVNAKAFALAADNDNEGI